MGWAHEWDVVGETGRIRFVESDEAGVPTDRRRYDALRAAQERGELAYRGLTHRPVETATVVERPDDSGGSYRQSVMDAADIASVTPGGTMGLYRDL